MNLNNRQQLLGIVAIAAIVLLAGDHLVVEPLLKLWDARSKEIAQLKKSVTQGARLLDREKVIRERWTHMRTNAVSGEISIAQNQVLTAFDRWSQDSRIGINGITPRWNHSSDDYATLECRVDAFGSLATITRFLYEIEKDPLGLKLDIVEITARDDRGRELNLGLQVSALQLNPNPNP